MRNPAAKKSSKTQRRSNQLKSNDNYNQVTAKFVEDDQFVDMNVDGLDSDFLSENEDTDSKNEVSFRQELTNNNAVSLNDMEEEERSEVSDDDFVGGAKCKPKKSVKQARLQGKRSNEERQEIIGEAIGQAVNQVQDMLVKSGILETAQLLKKQLSAAEEKDKQLDQKQLDQGQKGKNFNEDYFGKEQADFQQFLNASNSELTIYHNAVQDGTRINRQSSSSEEGEIEMDTSGDSNEVIIAGENGMSTTIDKIDKFIAEYRQKSEERQRQERQNDEPRPRTSRGMAALGLQVRTANFANQQQQQIPLTADHRANQLLQQAETSKARIFLAPGEFRTENDRFQCNLSQELVHSVMVDEKYLMIGTHLDETIRSKIVRGEYVEFENFCQEIKFQ